MCSSRARVTTTKCQVNHRMYTHTTATEEITTNTSHTMQARKSHVYILFFQVKPRRPPAMLQRQLTLQRKLVVQQHKQKKSRRNKKKKHKKPAANMDVDRAVKSRGDKKKAQKKPTEKRSQGRADMLKLQARIAELEKQIKRRAEAPPVSAPKPLMKPPVKKVVAVQCRFWTQGRCKNGSACRFLHGPAAEQPSSSVPQFGAGSSSVPQFGAGLMPAGGAKGGSKLALGWH